MMGVGQRCARSMVEWWGEAPEWCETLREGTKISAVIPSTRPIRSPSRTQCVPRHHDPSFLVLVVERVFLPSRSGIRPISGRSRLTLIAARAREQCHTLGPARRALRRCELGDVKNSALCENHLNVREPRPTVAGREGAPPTVTLRYPPPVASGAPAAKARNARLPSRCY
jgi:hypothetical protein